MITAREQMSAQSWADRKEDLPLLIMTLSGGKRPKPVTPLPHASLATKLARTPLGDGRRLAYRGVGG